jgi:tetratricopeptide (TPR) repeat protein
MNKVYKCFLSKTTLLILAFSLFVLTCLGQNGRTSICKATDYDCLIIEYAKAIAPKCKGKESDCWIAEYTKIIESNPNDGAAYYERGCLSYVKGTDRAILDFKKSIELNPKYRNAYSLLVMIYVRKEDYNQAIIVLNKAIELFPKDANFYDNRGYVYSRQGDFNKALADYNKAIELNPYNDTAYNNRAGIYSSQGYLDKALADYTKAVEARPNEWYSYFSRGAFYWGQGEKAKAVADFQMAKQLADPEEWQNRFVKILKTSIKEELEKLDASLLTSSAEEAAQIATYQRLGLGSFLFSCNDNNYTVVTTYKDFIDTPSWNPEKEENAPLSIRRALEIARTTLNQCHPKANNNWRLRNIQLESVGGDKWVYEINFDCTHQSCSNYRIYRIYVKLDGTAILPKPDAKPTEKLAAPGIPSKIP